MSEEEVQPIRTLAESYLEAQNQQENARIVELKDRLSDLKDRRDDYRQIHDSDSDLIVRVEKRIKDIEAEIQEYERSQDDVEELKEDLLTHLQQFALNEVWLNPTVLQAINHALLGEESETITIENTRIGAVDDVGDLDELDRFDIEDVVIRMATDELGESTHLKEMWGWMEKNDYVQSFYIVAEDGETDRASLADRLGDDVSPKDAQNLLERPIYNGEFNPYYRESGTFSLATPGRYMLANFGEEIDLDQSVKNQDDDEGDGQMSFNEVSSKGGGSNG